MYKKSLQFNEGFFKLYIEYTILNQQQVDKQLNQIQFY